MRPFCLLTIDVDSLDCYYRAYGLSRLPEHDRNAVYTVALPRCLEILGGHGARATFFVVADDLREAGNARRVRALAEAGHEVASHSLSHPLPFSRRSLAELRREVAESRDRLEQATGRPVRGFRAPGWDVVPELFPLLRQAGYRYDASVHPSFLVPWMKRWHRALSRSARTTTGFGDDRFAFQDRVLPYVVPPVEAASAFYEVPVTVVPRLRLPFFGTMQAALGDWYFRAAWCAVRRLPVVQYELHPIELLGIAEDRLPGALCVQPGMRRSLERKRRSYETMMRTFARECDFRTINEHLTESPPAP